MTLSDQIRAAINGCGLSMRQLARETGIAQPILSRFMSDDEENVRGISLSTADKLAAYFRLVLVEEAEPEKPARQSRKKK